MTNFRTSKEVLDNVWFEREDSFKRKALDMLVQDAWLALSVKQSKE